MQHFSCMAGASCSLAVTLPVFGGAPPLLVFQVLEWLAITFVYALFGLAVVSILVLVISLLVKLLYCVKHSSKTSEQQERLSCCRRKNSVFLSMGRFLCVHTFPALFKLHKTRSESDQSQTSKLMVFLDRKVEDNVPLVAAFCSVVFCIFCSSAAAFFRYFPVERSAECLEKDSHSRSLFCYSNVNSSLINPNLPVDCASYSGTELRELEFECYAIVFPAGLGIAVAAAFGLAEVGIVGVTIFIKVTEGLFKKTKNLKDKSCCCCCKWTCVNNTYVCSSVVLLVTVSLVSFLCAILKFIYFCTIDRMHLLLLLYYLAYPLLPTLLCSPLVYIIRM